MALPFDRKLPRPAGGLAPSGGLPDELGHRRDGGGAPGGVPGTLRRRVCKSCGRFADDHGRRRRAGACSAFIYSHSITLTWNAVNELYGWKERKRPG